MTGPSNAAKGLLFLRSSRWRVDVFAEIGTGYRQTRKQLWVTHCPTREQAEQAAMRRAAHEGSRGWRRTNPDHNIAWFITSPDGQPTTPVRLFSASPALSTDVEGAASPAPSTPARPLLLTAAQHRLMLEALEIRMSDLTEREDVLAVGEICNLLRIELDMAPREYWED